MRRRTNGQGPVRGASAAYIGRLDLAATTRQRHLISSSAFAAGPTGAGGMGAGNTPVSEVSTGRARSRAGPQMQAHPRQGVPGKVFDVKRALVGARARPAIVSKLSYPKRGTTSTPWRNNGGADAGIRTPIERKMDGFVDAWRQAQAQTQVPAGEVHVGRGGGRTGEGARACAQALRASAGWVRSVDPLAALRAAGGNENAPGRLHVYRPN